MLKKCLPAGLLCLNLCLTACGAGSAPVTETPAPTPLPAPEHYLDQPVRMNGRNFVLRFVGEEPGEYGSMKLNGLQIFRCGETEPFQTFRMDGPIADEGELRGGVLLEDMNFDGDLDFRIVGNEDYIDGRQYRCWLWDGEKEAFRRALDLEDLWNPCFDGVRKLVYQREPYGRDLCAYDWTEGKLSLRCRFTVDWEDVEGDPDASLRVFALWDREGEGKVRKVPKQEFFQDEGAVWAEVRPWLDMFRPIWETPFETAEFEVRGGGPGGPDVVVRTGHYLAPTWEFDDRVRGAVYRRGDDTAPLQLLTDRGDSAFWRDSEVMDINFDGYPDFGVVLPSGMHNSYFRWYLWDAEQGVFVETPELDVLVNPRVDAERQVVYAYYHETYYSGSLECYRWTDGGLELVRMLTWELPMEDGATGEWGQELHVTDWRREEPVEVFRARVTADEEENKRVDEEFERYEDPDYHGAEREES